MVGKADGWINVKMNRQIHIIHPERESVGMDGWIDGCMYDDRWTDSCVDELVYDYPWRRLVGLIIIIMF